MFYLCRNHKNNGRGQHGYGHRQVVQQYKGLWVHRTGRRGRPFCALLVDSNRGYRTLKGGQRVAIEVQKGDKGAHAINVAPAGESLPN